MRKLLILSALLCAFIPQLSFASSLQEDEKTQKALILSMPNEVQKTILIAALKGTSFWNLSFVCKKWHKMLKEMKTAYLTPSKALDVFFPDMPQQAAESAGPFALENDPIAMMLALMTHIGSENLDEFAAVANRTADALNMSPSQTWLSNRFLNC